MDGYRARVVASLRNSGVREFWQNRFDRWSPSLKAQSVEPVLNKIDAFLADDLLRRILAQGRSSFSFREVMDQGKILICNLSRGRMGDENANLLGGLLLVQLELAAMSRASVSAASRRDFYLYVDEFQRFATRSFTAIFSEARKYGLNITVANQYLDQLPDGVRRSILGNVGTLVSFRLGLADARLLAPHFGAVFGVEDFLDLDDYHAYVRPVVNGRVAAAFSMATFPPPQIDQGARNAVKAYTRAHYAIREPEATGDENPASPTEQEESHEVVYFD